MIITMIAAITNITTHNKAFQGDQTTWNSLTFPVEASKDYLVSSVYRYGQQLSFHINQKQGEHR